MSPRTTVLDCIGDTPLVTLENVGESARVPVLGKCEHLNPGGSIKDRIALAIVEAAEARGEIAPGGTLVEATAGNTGVGLALVAALRGYRLVCVMPEKMSHDKRRALAALGAEVVIAENCPPADPRSFQSVARRIAEEREGAMLTDQFNNPANPTIHETTTGPEIWRQCDGKVGAFVAGVGTGGSITGIGRFLKSRDPEVKIVLADPEGSRLAGLINDGELGADGSYLVEGIGSSVVPKVFDPTVVDWAETVSDAESFAMADRLVREEGLLVGGSAGTAVAAALRVAARDDIRGPVVALLPDGWDRYQTTHFDPAWREAKLGSAG
jgi:cystathionine beta-synthase